MAINWREEFKNRRLADFSREKKNLKEFSLREGRKN